MASPLFVAITAYYWGIGPTIEDAEKQMKKAGASAAHLKKCGYIVKQLPEGATAGGVDGYGSIFWEGAPEGTCTLVKDARKVARQ